MVTLNAPVATPKTTSASRMRTYVLRRFWLRATARSLPPSALFMACMAWLLAPSSLYPD